jgi:hypothetical protein
MPAHIGIILDGNRRYGRRHGLTDPHAIYSLGARKLDEGLAHWYWWLIGSADPEMAAIRTGSHPACGRVVPALLGFLALEELLAERLLQPTAFDSIVTTLQNQVRFNAARRDSCPRLMLRVPIGQMR